MKIHSIQSENTGDGKVICGCLDDFELWYRLPVEYGNGNLADAFLTAALMIAMKKGEDIHVDENWPVSFKLLQGLSELQDIYSLWFHELSPVTIHARTTAATTSQKGYATFFPAEWIVCLPYTADNQL